MKHTGLMKAMLLVMLCLAMVVSFAACKDEGNYYTKDDVTAMIEKLETALSESTAASNAKIEALEIEYLAKIAALEAEDAENAATIAALSANYNDKVAALEATDTENAEEMIALKAQYAADLAALQAKDTEIAAKIATLEGELAESIKQIKDTYNAKITSIENLIADLQAVDTESTKRIATLEAQMQQLLNPPVYTVSFDTDGGSAAPTAQKIEEHRKIVKPVDPTKQGYTFLGWYCGDELWSFSGHSVTEHMALTAKWRSDADHSDFFDFYPLPDGTYGVMAGKTLYLSEVVIPATYNGKPVTQILPQAFLKATNLEKITIPDSITDIGYSAFSDCSNLQSINIPEGVTTIGDHTFYNCSNLINITIPDSVTSIGERAFDGCSSLSNVTFGENSQLTSIGNSAFSNCSRLTDITIPASVTGIGEYAFSGCGKLIEKENGVSYVGKWAVYHDNSLATVTLRDDTIGIVACAFRYCSKMRSITIPASVTSIGESAFDYCSSLSSVTFETTSGWWYADSVDAISGTEISATSLAKTYTAATYLTDTYNWYFWKRG